MATHHIHSLTINSVSETHGLWKRYLAFVDSQENYSISWWIGSLMVHGCILVPLTFLLVYSFGGPTVPFLFISLICFFASFVANMASAGFRFTFNSFIFSIATHVLMVLATLIMSL